MRRDQLEHAIRTACQIIGAPEVIVVGSQSILGTDREEQLPPEATMSVEVDVLPIAESNEETARLPRPRKASNARLASWCCASKQISPGSAADLPSSDFGG